MFRALSRTALSVLLIALAAVMWWYGVSTNRLAVKDLVFLKDHFRLLQPFADAWLLRGNVSYYVDLDPQTAAASYRQTIARQPVMIEAWLNLAKVELAAGREEEARRILATLSPFISHVSTWKWQELLLARDLREEELFSAAFNFILARLPGRTPEACFLARGFWGDSQAVIPHVAEENRVVFLNELMKARAVEPSLALWKLMEEGRFPPDKDLRLRFCQFLILGDRLTDAKEIWSVLRDDGKQTVYNGGFEMELASKPFGWSFDRIPDVLIERTTENPFEGSYSLHLRFMGTMNVNYGGVRQLIPVKPGKVYRLKFARKSSGLTTDQGVRLDISGFRCEGLSMSSEAVLKRTPWIREELEVPVPTGCEAIMLMVRRNESLKFDNKISGDYWLDAVELTERHAP